MGCTHDSVGDGRLKLLGHSLRKIGAVPRRSTLIAFAVNLAFVAISAERAQAQLCVQLNGGTYTQNFNTLAVSGSSNNSTSLPIGFAFSESGTGNNVTYAAGDGSSSTPNTYSFGTGTNTDRAFGEVTGTTVQSTIGACFVNNTGSAISTFVAGYTGEQWRLGDSAAPTDKLDFQFSTSANALNSGTYTDADGLDFSSPNNAAGSVGALNGNSAGNRTVIPPFAITPTTPIAANATFFIRWIPLNAAGNNDGLAIDDFSLGYFAPPGLSADYNSNSEVDSADYVVWRKLFNTAGPLPNDAGISPGIVNAADFAHWKKRFGISTIPFAGSASGLDSTGVPEPASGIFLMAGSCVFALIVRRGRVFAERSS
jgi:hypothetical protein